MKNYLKALRINHWFKNGFILVGIFAALIYFNLSYSHELIWRLILAFLLVSLMASANYIMNGITDVKFDKQHPVKQYRPIPSGKVNTFYLKIIAVVLWVISLGVSWLVFGKYLFGVLIFFLVTAIIYNIEPIRTKNLPHLDVIVEALGNPVRLMVGWFAVGVTVFPPLIGLICFWAIGAFLMVGKRFTELRFLGNRETAINYRRVFKFYSEESLLIAMIVYLLVFGSTYTWVALLYDIKLMYFTPMVLIFIIWYFHLLFEKDSIIKEPERLIKKPLFMFYCILSAVILIIILFA